MRVKFYTPFREARRLWAEFLNRPTFTSSYLKSVALPLVTEAHDSNELGAPCLCQYKTITRLKNKARILSPSWPSLTWHQASFLTASDGLLQRTPNILGNSKLPPSYLCKSYAGISSVLPSYQVFSYLFYSPTQIRTVLWSLPGYLKFELLYFFSITYLYLYYSIFITLSYFIMRE